jgi:hypothetical protein
VEATPFIGVPPRGRRLAPLANPQLEERALPLGLPAGIRTIMRLIGPALARASKPDLRRWNVGRAERQGPGSAAREAFEAPAADLGVRSFEVYVSSTHPYAMVVEVGDPPAVVLGSGLLALGPVALRFAAGYCLRLCATHFDLLVQGGPTEAAALMAAIIRQFVPDLASGDVPEAAIAPAQARVARALSRGLRSELGPFATEVAGAYAPETLFLSLEEGAARAGLLACGDLATALDVLARAAGVSSASLAALGASSLAVRLVDFALSEDHEELVQAFDAVS